MMCTEHVKDKPCTVRFIECWLALVFNVGLGMANILIHMDCTPERAVGCVS